MNLPVVSVRQPWASLILAGVKKFEARSWAPAEPGCLILHASSNSIERIRERRKDARWHLALEKAGLTDERLWPRAAVLGVIEVKRIFEPYDSLRRLSTLDDFLGAASEEDFRWQIGRRWLLSRPIACAGKLGLWDPPSRVVAAIRRLRLPRNAVTP